MSNYQPNSEQVEQIAQLLIVAASGGTQGDHKAATSKLESFRDNADFFSVCAYLVGAESRETYLGARFQAGIYLKNNMRRPICAGNPVVQDYVLKALGDPAMSIRNAVATAISQAIFHRQWPISCVDAVLTRFNDSSHDSVLGALTTICDILEDNVELMAENNKTGDIIGRIVPFLESSNPPVMRKKAIHAVSVVLEEAGMHPFKDTWNACEPHAKNLLGMISQLLSIDRLEEETLCYCIRSINFLLVFEEAVSDSFDAVVSLMTKMAGHEFNEVRKEAIEFWSAVHMVPTFTQRIVSRLPDVIPGLINCMCYSEDELTLLGDQADAWDVEDKAEDIKPQKYQARHRAIGTEGDGDADDDEVLQSTLRANAGLALDKIAQYHGDQILGVVLSNVEEKMKTGEWLQQEAATMVLGSIAEGCYAGMIQWLPQLMGGLLDQLNNDNAHNYVHVITCWTIGQYSNWFDKEEGFGADFLPRTVQALLNRMKCPSKRLQAAATSALSTLCSTLYRGELEPWAVEIIQTINACIHNYKLKNRYLLFEVIDSVCNHLGGRVAQDDCFKNLMDPLIQLWQETQNDSPMLYPYFRCMSGVCQALGDAIEPFAKEIYQRSFSLMRQHAGTRMEARSNQNIDAPEEEFLVTALDLLSGLSSALGASMYSLVQGEDQIGQFVETIGWCIFDTSPSVRQQALALIGDLCSSSVGLVQSMLPDLRKVFYDSLKVEEGADSMGEASNTAWILNDLLANQIDDGNSACLTPNDLEQYLPLLMSSVIAGAGEKVSQTFAENCAVAIGRFLLIDLQVLQRVNSSWDWLVPTLQTLKRIQSTFWGKEDSVQGVFSAMVQSGLPPPAQAQEPFFAVLDIAYQFDQPSNVTANAVSEVLQLYKNMLGAQWDTMIKNWDQHGKKIMALRTFYKFG